MPLGDDRALGALAFDRALDVTHACLTAPTSVAAATLPPKWWRSTYMLSKSAAFIKGLDVRSRRIKSWGQPAR